MLATLAIGQLATEYAWLPDRLDLLNGMALGAGLGAAVGGGISLLPWGPRERMAAAGTIVGVVVGGAAVAIGKAGIDFTAAGDGISLPLISALIAALAPKLARHLVATDPAKQVSRGHDPPASERER